jgi:hypothetical protein
VRKWLIIRAAPRVAAVAACARLLLEQRVVKIAGKGSNLLFEGTVDRAKLTIHSLAASQPWTQGEEC